LPEKVNDLLELASATADQQVWIAERARGVEREIASIAMDCRRGLRDAFRRLSASVNEEEVMILNEVELRLAEVSSVINVEQPSEAAVGDYHRQLRVDHKGAAADPAQALNSYVRARKALDRPQPTTPLIVSSDADGTQFRAQMLSQLQGGVDGWLDAIAEFDARVATLIPPRMQKSESDAASRGLTGSASAGKAGCLVYRRSTSKWSKGKEESARSPVR